MSPTPAGRGDVPRPDLASAESGAGGDLAGPPTRARAPEAPSVGQPGPPRSADRWRGPRKPLFAWAMCAPFRPGRCRGPCSTLADVSLRTGTFTDMRPRLELVVRLGCRVSQLASPVWSDRPFRLRSTVLGASAAADIALVAWLRRHPADGRVWITRLAHLAIDVAANVALFDDRTPYIPALVPACGPALETGYSGNRSATVAVPLACLVGMAGGKALRNRPPSPASPVLFTGLVELMGWSLRWYERAQAGSARRAEQIDMAAMAAEARSVAHFWLYNTLDGSRLLDDLKNAINPLLGADPQAVVAAQAMLQRQKEHALEPLTTAITLRRALKSAEASRYWEATNRASTFRPIVDERSGETVLTPRQANQLLGWIDREFVTGQPVVRLVSGGQDVGSGLTLSIGGRRCRLRADQAPIELGPLGWLGASAMIAQTAAPWDGSVSPSVAATSSGLFAGSAMASRMILNRRGRAGRGAATVVGAVPALVHSLLGTMTMKDEPSPTGVARYPAVIPLMAIGLEAGHYWPDLGLRARFLLAAIAGASVAPSWLFCDHDNRALFAGLVLPVQHFVLSRHLRRLVDDTTSAAAAETQGASAEATRRAREQGLADEIHRLGQWVDDADRVLVAAVEADEELRHEAASRLARVRALLDEIAAQASELPSLELLGTIRRHES